MFDSLSDKLGKAFTNLRSKGKLSEADIEETARHIRLALLEADVALPVVKEFIDNVKTEAQGAEVSAALNPAQQVVKIVNDQLVKAFGEENPGLEFAKVPPTVIMLVGLQGAGKTTLAGKLAKWLKDQNHTPLLVADDLQRPGAVKQLQTVGEQANVPVYAPDPGNIVDSGLENTNISSANPIQIAKDSLKIAKDKQHDVVIIDTAGRLGVDTELMQQAADIKSAVNPDNILFVLDAMVGQDAVATAAAFKEGVDFTGVVLTKLDGDARGGAALSVKKLTGVPVLFASTGEKLADFDLFYPDRMASRILDMGDILTLIEKAEKVFDEQQAEEAAQRISDGSLSLTDFMNQLRMIRNMGPLGNILGMLPGAGKMKDVLANIDEKKFDHLEAIINGMTPAERDNPKIINASRRLRIANGSGASVSEVNQLVNQFENAKKMMSSMTGKLGMPGGAKRGLKKNKKGKKVRKKSFLNNDSEPIFARSTTENSPLGGAFPNMPKGLTDLPPALRGMDMEKLMQRNIPKDPKMRKNR